MKGPSLAPKNPYVAANELISTALAELLGLPVLDYCLLELAGSLFFGSAWMHKADFVPQISERLFQQCTNRDLVYRLVAFDVWVGNIDRHARNLVVRRTKTNVSGQYTLNLLLNDHSHCLLPPNLQPDNLAERVVLPVGRHVQLPFLRAAIVDGASLRRAIDAVMGIPDDTLRLLIDQTPSEFLPLLARPVVSRFLIDRRSKLRQIFQVCQRDFANLRGGAL